MTDPIQLSVVAFEQDGLWTAQALEHDIAAFAESLPKVLRKFERTVLANLTINRELGRQGLDGIPSAPERFHAMFEQSQLDVKPRQALTMRQTPSRISHLRVAEAA